MKSESAMIQNYLNKSMDDYITKPLHPFVVRETIHGIVNNVGYM